MFIKFLLIWINLSVFIHCLQEIYPFATPNNCTNTQYFNLDSYKCSDCPSSFVKSVSGLSCSCIGVNKYEKFSNDSTKLNCSQCKISEYLSKDKIVCVPRNCFSIGNGKITCAVCKKTQIIVTNALNGSALPAVECITCSPGFVPSIDKTSCEPCNLKTFNTNQKLCECDNKKAILVGNICVSNSFLKNITQFMPTTIAGESFHSTYFDSNLISSLYLCSLKNITACQLVSNLCTFSMYSNAENSPCTMWKKLKFQVPVILYGEEEAFSVLYRKKIEVTYSLINGLYTSHLNIIGFKFNSDGIYQGLTDSNTPWMFSCPVVWKTVGKNLFKFANNYRHKCVVGAQQLVSESKSIIYEPYLKYTDESKESVSFLHAIPILIKGNLVHFNKENDINTWQLVRRFYIFDKISGISSEKGINIMKYFRYVKHFEIRIKIRRRGKGERSKIYPPLFIVEYGELNENELKDNINVNMEFSITYELDGANMVNEMEIAIGSISAFAVLYTIIQTWSFSKRSGKFALDAFTFTQFFIFACGNLADSFFIVSFGASSYSFFVHKMQKVIYILPPNKREEYVIQTYLIVALSLKVIEVIAMNWRQITVDISFVDWEKPIQPLLEIGIKTPSKSNLKAETPVLFWRPYFVANEWNEIQTLRKISLCLHLVICIFVLEIFGIKAWANVGIEVESSNSENFITSSSYQLALSGIVFLILYFLQLILSIFCYERFVKNSILDFMDVCSIANVSVFILDMPLHGYYLHGRSIHASCETDVRGLHPGLPYRAFSIRCTPDFRLYFNRLSTHMVTNGFKWQWQHHILTNGNIHSNMESSTIGSHSARKSSGRSSKRGDEDAEVNTVPTSIHHRDQAAKLTNKFLTAFLEHSLEDLDYDVREKRFLECLLDVELMDDGNYKSLFLYNTSGDSQSFQRCIWYGQEWTLATFDLYLFCLVQMLTGNYVTAALVTIIMWKVLEICRQYGGKKNLAKKTLIDERFLI